MPAAPPAAPHAPRFRVMAGPIPAPLLPAEARPALPLYGLTILAVEDSRFTCEALRLMCQRAGARLRRAETLAAAEAHLRVYRPDVVIIDLGLPDGRGDGLIRNLVLSPRRPKVVLGTSGNPEGRALALAAGADGFLDKPLENLSGFCRALARHLPELDIIAPAERDGHIHPDRLALHDDLAHAAAAMGDNPGLAEQRYLSGFLRGLARHAHDAALEQAALAAESHGIDDLRRLVNRRLARAKAAFAAEAPD